MASVTESNAGTGTEKAYVRVPVSVLCCYFLVLECVRLLWILWDQQSTLQDFRKPAEDCKLA